MISNLKSNVGCTDDICSLEAEGHSKEESNKYTHVQEPKTNKTISNNMDANNKIAELSDLSASTRKRGRNPHSSTDPKNPIS
jgi:hypothetical protein